MGVHLLSGYCKEKGLWRKTEVQRNTHKEKRLLVFDAPAALRKYLLPQGRPGVIYDLQQQQRDVSLLVKTANALGYELAVFLDNAIPEEKLDLWYKRR
jgi:alpha-D-ribose 1-methylphosphonate 5-triphosphate synthase subunit PhnH